MISQNESSENESLKKERERVESFEAEQRCRMQKEIMERHCTLDSGLFEERHW